MQPKAYSQSEKARNESVQSVANFFAELANDPLARLRKRRTRVAAQLAAMIANLGFSHAKVAAKSGIKPSQMSRQLAGDGNLTLDTISRICDAVGTDFDIVFRKAEDSAAKQWWEHANLAATLEGAYSRLLTQSLERDWAVTTAELAANWTASKSSTESERRKLAFSLDLNNVDAQSGQISSTANTLHQAANDEAQFIAA